MPFKPDPEEMKAILAALDQWDILDTFGVPLEKFRGPAINVLCEQCDNVCDIIVAINQLLVKVTRYPRPAEIIAHLEETAARLEETPPKDTGGPTYRLLPKYEKPPPPTPEEQAAYERELALSEALIAQAKRKSAMPYAKGLTLPADTTDLYLPEGHPERLTKVFNGEEAARRKAAEVAELERRFGKIQ